MDSDSSPSLLLNSLLMAGPKSGADRLGATMSALIDSMDIAMWELDRDYRVVGFNRKAREIYGESALGRCCYQAAAQGDTVCDNCPAAQVFSGQASGRSERRRTSVSGKTIYIDHIATPIMDKNSMVTGALILIIDITRHKEQELELIARRNDFEQRLIERTRALEESREQYRQLYEESKKGEALSLSVLNATADAIVISSLHGEVRYVNPGFTRTFGWQLEELEGKPLALVGGMGCDVSTKQFRLLKERGQPITHCITKWPTRDGRLLDVSLSAARYGDHQGHPIGFVCSIRDITEAKALELQFFRAQKFEALGTMAGGLAHDFNNLLMGIQGNASLMQFELRNSGLVNNPEKLNNIERYVQQGEQLTRQMLTLARNDAQAIATVDLNRLISASGSLFGQTRKELTIIYQLHKGVWPVQADAGQIEQVLLNLFVNAAHAMPGGGELRICTENVHLEERETLPFHQPAGRYVRITVTDSGCGIDPAILDRIFDPFFTTKGEAGGTGLGLASAYSIINNHKGMIRGANAPRGGGAVHPAAPGHGTACCPGKGAEARVPHGHGNRPSGR